MKGVPSSASCWHLFSVDSLLLPLEFPSHLTHLLLSTSCVPASNSLPLALLLALHAGHAT